MANVKISGMTDAGSVTDNDLAEMTQASTTSTKSWKMSYMKTYILGSNITLSSSSISLSNAGGSTTNLNVAGEGTTTFTGQRFSNDASQPQVVFQKARGTIASPLAVQNSDFLGSFNFYGYAGGSFVLAGRLITLINESGTIGSSVLGSRMLFAVNGAGTATQVTAMTLDSNNATVPGTMTTSALTFSALPASPSAGARSYITDGNVALAFGTAVTAGGGSNKGPVYYDGTNWRWG